jgi:hypothetical protein
MVGISRPTNIMEGTVLTCLRCGDSGGPASINLYALLRLVPRVRHPTPVLQAAAVGVPSPLRHLVSHIRRASAPHKHPTPKPRPPYGNVRSAVSFLEFKIQNSNCRPLELAGEEKFKFEIRNLASKPQSKNQVCSCRYAPPCGFV